MGGFQSSLQRGSRVLSGGSVEEASLYVTLKTLVEEGFQVLSPSALAQLTSQGSGTQKREISVT